MSSPHRRIYDTAAALLDAVVAYYAQIATEFPSDAPAPLPDRQYVHAGEVSFDCDELVVTGVGLFQGQPNLPVDFTPIRCEVPRTARLEVWLVRCVPAIDDDGAPEPAEETESAHDILTDLWMVPQAIFIAYKNGTLDLPGRCELLGLGSASIQGPQGAYTATAMEVQVTV